MSSEVLTVALLARPGAACDRLRDVIGQAGAQCVLEADPVSLDPAELAGLQPDVVLVALDPQTEDALERFDEILLDSGLEVIYEEASLAASREGWDMARWQRHLVAKMQRHGDVFPPGTEQDEAEDDAPAPDTGSAGLTGLADPLPTPAEAIVATNIFDPVQAETGGDELPPPEPATGPNALLDMDDGSPDVAAAIESEVIEWTGGWDVAAPEAEPAPVVVADNALSIDDSTMDSTALDSSATDKRTDDLQPDDAGFPPEAGISIDPVPDPAPELEPEPVSEPEAQSAPEVPPGRGFGELTLDDGSAALQRPDDEETKGRFTRDISDLAARISGLSLVDDTPPTDNPNRANGAVLVLAGLGGPDAVRQLLGAIPEGFPRPVLVQQRLEVGHYDKLVAQMQRATSLPVRLAEVEQFAHPGFIYILPPDIGLDVNEVGICFNDGGDLLAPLPAGDSAVLLLSGSDPLMVNAVLKHGWAGALVAGQVADGCYDPAASNELATRGGDTGTPVELAQKLAQRWPA